MVTFTILNQREYFRAPVGHCSQGSLGEQFPIAEAILQTLPIAGFPAVTNAFLAARDVLT